MMQYYYAKFAKATLNPGDIGYETKVTTDNTFLTDVLNTVYFWAAVVAVIVIVIAGYYFATANGSSDQVARAKKMILGAVIGLVVVLSAFVITQFVLGRF